MNPNVENTRSNPALDAIAECSCIFKDSIFSEILVPNANYHVILEVLFKELLEKKIVFKRGCLSFKF